MIKWPLTFAVPFFIYLKRRSDATISHSPSSNFGNIEKNNADAYPKTFQFGCDSIIPYQIGFQQQPDAVDDALEIPLNTTESVIDVLKNDRFFANLIDILIRRQLSVGTLEVQSLGVYKVKILGILTDRKSVV